MSTALVHVPFANNQRSDQHANQQRAVHYNFCPQILEEYAIAA